MKRYRLMRILALIAFLSIAINIGSAADKPETKKSPYVTVQVVKGTVEKLEKSGQLTAKIEVNAPNAQGRMAKKMEQMVLEMAPDAIIRTNVLPPKESPNPKKPARYTAAELKKFKGPNPKLPGYEAKAEDLHNGLIVQFELGLTKDESKEKSTQYKVKSILILGDAMAK